MMTVESLHPAARSAEEGHPNPILSPPPIEAPKPRTLRGAAPAPRGNRRRPALLAAAAALAVLALLAATRDIRLFPWNEENAEQVELTDYH